MCVQNGLLLSPSVRAARHPDGASGSVELAQPAPALGDIRRHGEVKLQIPGDVRAVGIGAEGAEAIRITLALRGHDHCARQGLLEQRPETPVAFDRARREPSARKHERHTAAPTLAIQVGPKLGLEDHGQTWMHSVEESPHRPGQVVRDIANVRQILE